MPIVTRSIHHHHHIFDVSIVKYPYIRVPLVRSNVTSKKFNAFIKQLSAADSLTQINVDFECVSIQWLWLCVLLLLYVFFFFCFSFFILACGCLNFHLSMFVFTNCVFTLTSLCLAWRHHQRERISGKERQKNKSATINSKPQKKHRRTLEKDIQLCLFILQQSSQLYFVCISYTYEQQQHREKKKEVNSFYFAENRIEKKNRVYKWVYMCVVYKKKDE